MRARPIIHVGGPTDAGKTSLFEAFLGKYDGFTLVARARRDDSLRQYKETKPKRDREQRCYPQAGRSFPSFRLPSAIGPDSFLGGPTPQNFGTARDFLQVAVEGRTADITPARCDRERPFFSLYVAETSFEIRVEQECAFVTSAAKLLLNVGATPVVPPHGRISPRS